MVRGYIASLILTVAVAGMAYGDVDTRDGIFSPRFKTLKTSVIDHFDAPPVLRMGSNDRLEILFDEIGEDNSWLEWRLVHCNADWQPSVLVDSEIVDGFNARPIEDMAYSSATYVHYVNYRIEIPDERTGILHSGNYLLQVYDPDKPDEVLLQTRFRVSENIAAIAGGYDARTDRGYNSEWQQLSLMATVDLSEGANPYSDFRLQISQNDRDAVSHTIPVPARVNGNKLIYDHVPSLIFPASNEYRRFESISNGFPGMNVDSLRYMGSNYHVWLKPDYRRDNSQYQYDSTQHGRFLIREYNATDSNIGADYITVHFFLDTEEIPDAEVYVDGEMTHGRFDATNRMRYSGEKGGYVLELPLKQGAYNYQYVARYPNGEIKGLDGNKYETANQYSVSLWQRRPGERADRLIGFTVIE